MNNAARQSPDDEAPATLPQIAPPPRIGQGHPDFMVFQGLMDLKASVAEIKASVDTLAKTVDSTKSKVDKIIEWKNKILGGAIALGAVFALLGFLVTKFSAYVTIKSPEAAATDAPSQAPQQQVIVPGQKPK